MSNTQYNYNNSFLEQIDGVDRVVLNEKDHYQTGFAMGSLLIQSHNPVFTLMHNPLFRIIAKIGYTMVHQQFKNIVIPQEYLDELRGCSDATRTSFQDLFLLNFGFDTSLLRIFGCSSFSFFNSDGSCVIGHNTDYSVFLAKKGINYFRAQVVEVTIPGKQRTTYVSMPMFVGVMNGWNESGVIVNAHAIDVKKPERMKKGFSTPLLTRCIIDNASSVDDVRHIINQTLPTKPVHVMVTDTKGQSTISFEVTSSIAEEYKLGDNKYHACTNHFRTDMLQELQNSEEIKGSYDRLETCEAALQQYEHLDVDVAIELLQETSRGLKRDTTGHSLTNEGTFQSFVVRFPQNEVWISNGDRLPASLTGKYVKIMLC